MSKLGLQDFLEPAWDSANSTATYGYRASYSTQYNQIGRCFNGGVNGTMTSTSPRSPASDNELNATNHSRLRPSALHYAARWFVGLC